MFPARARKNMFVQRMYFLASLLPVTVVRDVVIRTQVDARNKGIGRQITPQLV